MDLFRKCMEPVEKCLRDAKMDKSSVGCLLATPLAVQPAFPSRTGRGGVAELAIAHVVSSCWACREQGLRSATCVLPVPALFSMLHLAMSHNVGW